MYSYKTGIQVIDEVLDGLEPGTNILILTPSLCGGDLLGYLISKPLEGEFSIILSTNRRSIDLDTSMSVTDLEKSRIGIIDTVTKLSSPEVADSTRVKYVASPSDLTGIGIKFSRMVEEIFRGDFSKNDVELFPPPIRFYIDSLSTLLMYRKLEVLYQFLHVITAKLKKMEALGIYVLNKDSFDLRTIALMEQLMDVVIDIKEESNIESFSVKGVPGVSSDWVRYHIKNGNLVVES